MYLRRVSQKARGSQYPQRGRAGAGGLLGLPALGLPHWGRATKSPPKVPKDLKCTAEILPCFWFSRRQHRPVSRGGPASAGSQDSCWPSLTRVLRATWRRWRPCPLRCRLLAAPVLADMGLGASRATERVVSLWAQAMAVLCRVGKGFRHTRQQACRRPVSPFCWFTLVRPQREHAFTRCQAHQSLLNVPLCLFWGPLCTLWCRALGVRLSDGSVWLYGWTALRTLLLGRRRRWVTGCHGVSGDYPF